MNWSQVISDIGPRLYRYFCASFAPQQASDLTQETLIRLVTKYEHGAYDPAQGTLLMFAYGIARLVRLEAWKSLPTEDPSGDPRDFDHRSDPHAVDSPGLEAELQARRLRQAIETLGEPQKQIILLHIDQDLALQEIAAIVGIPLNTVKSHIHRAKDLLRKKLNPEGVSHE